jgi:hypothetical protein
MHKIIAEDNFIWDAHNLIMYLYQCIEKNTNPVVDFFLEGPCANTTGLYRLLDSFCDKNSYSKEKITICTGNIIEHHPQYKIKKKYDYWYELKLIQEWMKSNNIQENIKLTKHFGIFIGRSTWARSWVSSHLHTYYKEKTLQTFHNGFHKNYAIPIVDGLCDNLGLDNLNRHGCEVITQVAKFLELCPILLDNDFDVTSAYITPTNKNYPIQHPANMRILNQYKHFCIDVVAETRVEGELFFCTEKIWRPIIARRPFIVIGPRHFLKNLKKLGFQTFNYFWDEGYDDYDSADRIRNVITLIDSLAQKSITEIHTMLDQMQNILENNYKVFHSLTYQKIKEIFDE